MSGEAHRVFISYSHDDESLRRELETHLALLKREGKIRTWHDREISAGEEWRGQIAAELDAADLILLLISASFIASDYCWDVETTRALERHALGAARVVPILVRPCDWQGAPFAELQGLPADLLAVTEWPNRDAAWADVARGLRRALDARPGEVGPPETRPPGPPAAARPRYADEESRRLSLRLKGLFQQRKTLAVAGGDTRAIEGEILDLRRLLRKGPQLRAGEFLGDGRYELLEPVGQGGFATVWKAWDNEGEGRLVALKVLHGHYSEDRSKRERFFRGARKMAELVHPHVVRVFESELEDEGWHFFVMEYVTGGNFEQAVLAGRLSREERIEVLMQVGEALELAHRRGAVHRDVKPQNILLDGEGRARLTDFDLVRAADTTGLTATRAILGTVQFAAPEALGSAGDVGPAADVYSLGATAVFALLGERLPPWFYRQPASVVAGLESGEELKRILARATAFDPEDRFASVGELCAALAAAAQRVGPPRRQVGSETGESPVVAADGPRATESSADHGLEGRKDGRGLKFTIWRALSVPLALVAIGAAAGFFLYYGITNWGWLQSTAPPEPQPGIAPLAPPATGSRESGALWTGPLEMRFRYIPAGRFQMGSPETEDGRDDDETLREFELTHPFLMGETEVTQGQWEKLMGNNPSRFKNCGADCPVEQVSWWDAVTFANRLSDAASLEPCYELVGCTGEPGTPGYSCESAELRRGLDCAGYRLPTEAEWEYAARGNDDGALHRGSHHRGT